MMSCLVFNCLESNLKPKGWEGVEGMEMGRRPSNSCALCHKRSVCGIEVKWQKCCPAPQRKRCICNVYLLVENRLGPTGTCANVASVVLAV